MTNEDQKKDDKLREKRTNEALERYDALDDDAKAVFALALKVAASTARATSQNN